MFSFFSRAKKDDEYNDLLPLSRDEETATNPTVESVESIDPQMTTAQRIDAYFAKIADEEAEKTLRGENGPRNLIFNPNIKPEDKKWLKVKADIISELAHKSMLDVLKSQHEIDNGDALLLVPARPGAIRILQRRNEKDYKANLAPGGHFHGQADNAVTKLIMLKFGLPIAPITTNNILHAGDYPDRDDPPDGPEKEPRFQRIEFAEKPLEFLDTYNERSYGWKILRRKTPSQPPSRGIAKPPRRHQAHMRGGGLATKSSPSKPAVGAYIYSHMGGRAQVSEDVNSFIQESLRLLGMPSDSDWKFVVEPYNNNIKHQNQPFNPYYPKGPASYSLITKDDTSSWDEKICSRVFQPKGVWRMAVRPADNTPAPEYLLAAIEDGVGKLYASKPTPEPESETTAIRPLNTQDEQKLEAPGKGQRLAGSSAWIWALDNPDDPGDLDHPGKYGWVIPADPSFDSFVAAALSHLRLNQNDWHFQVGLYVSDPGDTTKWIHRSCVELNSEDPLVEVKFEMDIAPNLYSSSQHWAGVVLLPEHNLLEEIILPEEEYAEADEDDEKGIDNSGNSIEGINASGDDGIDFSNNDEGDDVSGDGNTDTDSLSEVDNNIVFALANNQPITLEDYDTFVDAVLAKMGQSKSEKWGFSVDRYSCPRKYLTADLEHSFVFNEKSPADRFDKEILSRCQDSSRNWCFVARPSGQVPLSTFEIYETPEVEMPFSSPQGRIYGYAGQIHASHDPESVLEAIHSLLGFDISRDWSFVVDIHLARVETINITAKTWSEVYEKVISPSIKEDKQWPIFVRRNAEPISTSLEPPETLDVIYLSYKEVGIAYWKVPKQMDVAYGTNQPQTDFRRAMQLFFPGNTRPAKNVYVSDKPLGFGSINLTSDLWDHAQAETAASWSDFRDKKAQDPATIGGPHCFQFDVVLEDAPVVGNDLVAVRYVGNPEFSHARIPMMAREIEILGRNRVADRKLPKSFRIWRTAHDRESQSAGELLNFGTSTANIKALENWFYSGQGEHASCLEFCAEWETLELSELEHEGQEPVSWKWDTKSNNSTLHNFYDAIKSHYEDKVAIGKQSIKIYEPHSRNRFILASDTDEKNWRVDVYDWFSSTSLQIQPIDDIKYIIDTSTPWALPIHLLTTFGKKTSPARPSTTTSTTKRSPLGLPSLKPAVKFSKDRVDHHFRVSNKVPPRWDVWQAEQNVLDKLQNSTYLAPQPIVEPGLAPDAPLFAESRELALAVSQNTPTVYASVLTPTDVRYLRLQSRRLLNQVLERTSSCVVCNATFELYKTKEKQEHYDLHRQAIDCASVCVLCEDKNWRFWTAEEKRQHLYQHQARDEGRIAKTFWAGFECPGCDLDLSTLGDKNDVLKHVIAHDPQTIRFCDRCGKSYKSCTATELAHHDRVCIEGPDREPETALPSFCKGCGINKTNMTEEQDKLHSARAINCFTKDTFCTTCGFDMTDLTLHERSRHVATCNTPGGPAKTYCCRCGEEFGNLKGHARKDHSKFCKSAMNMEPDIVRHANARFKEIDAHIQINHENDAKRLKANYSLHQREKRVKAQEAALGRKEALFNSKVNPLGAYQKQDTTTHRLVQDILSDPVPGTTAHGLVQNLVRGPTVAAASTQSTQRNVETFTCPLAVISSNGSSSMCGQIINLRNGGVEVVKHYEHIGSGGHHGPNSVRAKQQFDWMHQKTTEYTDIINNMDSLQGKQNDSSGLYPGITITTPTPTGPGQTGTPPLTGARPKIRFVPNQGNKSQSPDIYGSDSDEIWHPVETYTPIIAAWDTVRQKIIDHSAEYSAKQGLACLLAWEIAYKGNQAVLDDIEKVTTQIENDHQVTRPDRLQPQLYKDSQGTSHPEKNGTENRLDDAIKTITNIGVLRTFQTFGAPKQLDPQDVAYEFLSKSNLDSILNRIEAMEIAHKKDAAALRRLSSVKDVLTFLHPAASDNEKLQRKTPKDTSVTKPSSVLVYHDSEHEHQPESLTDEQKMKNLKGKAAREALDRPRAHEDAKAKRVLDAQSNSAAGKTARLELEGNNPDGVTDLDEDEEDGGDEDIEDDNLEGTESGYLVTPRKDLVKKKTVDTPKIDEEPKYQTGTRSTSTSEIVTGKLESSTSEPDTVMPAPRNIENDKKRSSSVAVDDEPESPVVKKQKIVGNTAPKYVSKSKPGSSVVKEEPKTKRRSTRVTSNRPGTLKETKDIKSESGEKKSVRRGGQKAKSQSEQVEKEEPEEESA